MTPKQQAAMQQALEALESIGNSYFGFDDDVGECASCGERSWRPHAPDCQKTNAITALRKALAEPVQEAVAWRVKNATPPGGYVVFQQYPSACAELGKEIEPLYTAHEIKEKNT